LGRFARGPNINKFQPPATTLRRRPPILKLVSLFQRLRNPLKLHRYAAQTAENKTSQNKEFKEYSGSTMVSSERIGEKGNCQFRPHHQDSGIARSFIINVTRSD
jgi:hypothetical protein